MKKAAILTTVIALAAATQALAVGGSRMGSTQMTTPLSRTTMQAGSMTTSAAGMTQSAMNGTGTMSTTMSGPGTKSMPSTPVMPTTPPPSTMKSR